MINDHHISNQEALDKSQGHLFYRIVQGGQIRMAFELISETDHHISLGKKLQGLKNR